MTDSQPRQDRDKKNTPNARKYWSVLKTRLKKEVSELATNCSQLKLLASDGKQYLTDVADTEQVLRLIQSVPSKKAKSGILRTRKMNYQPLPKPKDELDDLTSIEE